jgi:cytochrome c oxidase subunit 4
MQVEGRAVAAPRVSRDVDGRDLEGRAVTVPPLRRYVGAWVALLALLAVTCASAFVPMGYGNAVANFAIAFAKAAIVMLVFMEAARSGGFVRLLAVAGLAWLLMLGGLAAVDYGTRGPANAPHPAATRGG